jgi:hypothetical protein
VSIGRDTDNKAIRHNSAYLEYSGKTPPVNPFMDDFLLHDAAEPHAPEPGHLAAHLFALEAGFGLRPNHELFALELRDGEPLTRLDLWEGVSVDVDARYAVCSLTICHPRAGRISYENLAGCLNVRIAGARGSRRVTVQKIPGVFVHATPGGRLLGVTVTR